MPQPSSELGGRSRPLHVLLGVCASSAAVAAPQLAVLLRAHPAVQRLTVVMTPTAADLVGTSAVAVAAQVEPLVGWGRIPVHVELARSIDCALVAPATATTLARLAAGDASNLLLATLLATTAPVHVYPSMNREMWEKPAVRRNVSVLEGDGLVVVPPVLGPRIGVPGGATETGSIGLTPAALAELLDHWTQER